MTTDTKPIAELPKCGRRWLMQNAEGVHIWCEPPTSPQNLAAAEAVKNPQQWFGRRRVTSEECLNCVMREPERLPRPGLDVEEIFSTKETALPQDTTTHARPRIFADGTIAYPKRGWEPPLVPAGYRRKSDDLRSSDAWVFLPVLNPCKHRSKTIKYSRCGAAQVVYDCQFLGQVQPPQCQGCKEHS